jgi:hypothetical protein
VIARQIDFLASIQDMNRDAVPQDVHVPSIGRDQSFGCVAVEELLDSPPSEATFAAEK